MKNILSKFVVLSSLFVLVGLLVVSCDKKKTEPDQKKTYKELIVGSWKIVAIETTRNGNPIKTDDEIGIITVFNANGTSNTEGQTVDYKIENDKLIIYTQDTKDIIQEFSILELNEKTLKIKFVFVDGPDTDVTIVTNERVK